MTDLRVGTAFDAHQIQAGKACWIAGILHEGQDGCEGHSDGDVVSHAIVDAVLSASGLGDLGSFVGVGRPEYDGVRGVELLQELKELIENQGHRVVNVSAQLIGQTPKMGPVRRTTSTSTGWATAAGCRKAGCPRSAPSSGRTCR